MCVCILKYNFSTIIRYVLTLYFFKIPCTRVCFEKKKLGHALANILFFKELAVCGFGAANVRPYPIFHNSCVYVTT